MVFVAMSLASQLRAQSNCTCSGGGLNLTGSSSFLLSDLIAAQQLPPDSSDIACISVPANTTLTIDVDYTFSGTEFNVDTGYCRIIVEQDVRLTLRDQCDLKGCNGGIWHIFLQPGSASTNIPGGQLDMSDSEIKGGINAEHLSSIRLVNNDFTGGSTALYVKGYVSFIHPGDPNDFKNNSFSGYYNPIWLDQAISFNIGNKDDTLPVIINYIYGYGSTVEPSFAVFVTNCINIGIHGLDISGFFPATANTKRRAIYIYNTFNISIKRCNIHPDLHVFGIPGYGIRGERVYGAIDVQKNNITAITAGIFLDNEFQHSKIDIRDNTIRAQTGLDIQNGRRSELIIRTNTINHIYSGATDLLPCGGILLTNVKGQYEIINNIINELPGGLDDDYYLGDLFRNIGLQVCSARGNVSGNTIDYPVLANTTGIGIYGTKNVSLVGNTLSGQLHDDKQGHGIHVINSSNLYFCCNTVDQTDYGAYFASANTDVKFLTTTYGTHDTALYFPPAASISKQFNTGNTWAGATTDLDAFYNGDFNQAQKNAPFRTNSANINATKILPFGWFFFGGNDPSCTGQSYPCVATLPQDTIVTELTDDDLVALSEPEYDNEYVLRFEQQRLLYRKLKEFPGLIEWNEDVSDFYYHADTSAVGAFDAIDEGFRSLFGLSAGLSQQFDELLTNVDSLSALVDLIYAQYPVASPSQQVELREDLQKLTDQMVAYLYELDTLTAQGHIEIQDNLTQLLEENNALNVEETWEYNERDINVLFFKFYGGMTDSFTNSEKEDIVALANTCPQFEGAGVYKARLLRSTFTDSTYFGYYENHCVPNEFKISQNQSIYPPENAFSVYPNPASDIINIQIYETVARKNKIVITDVAGHVIRSANIDSPTAVKLDVSSMPRGIYFITLYSELLSPVSVKMIVSR